MPYTKNTIGQPGIEPGSVRIMSPTAARGARRAAQAPTGTRKATGGRKGAPRLSRALSRAVARLEGLLAEVIALPTHELAEAADLTIAQTLSALHHLEQAGRVRRALLPAHGGTLWTQVGAEVAA